MARGKMWNVNEWADPLGHLEEMNKKRNIYWGNSIDMWNSLQMEDIWANTVLDVISYANGIIFELCWVEEK